MQQDVAAAGGASQPAAPKLLMDVDTADLLGLMPPVTGSPTRSGSFGSSGSSGWSGSPPGGKLRQPVVPLWFDEQLSQQMQASLVSSGRFEGPAPRACIKSLEHRSAEVQPSDCRWSP